MAQWNLEKKLALLGTQGREEGWMWDNEFYAGNELADLLEGVSTKKQAQVWKEAQRYAQVWTWVRMYDRDNNDGWVLGMQDIHFEPVAKDA